ncbi:hypothetical protein ACFE04_012400 [Oxalis oulophora]
MMMSGSCSGGSGSAKEIVLDHSNFYTAVLQHPLLLVVFYLDKDCKAFAYLYDQLSKLLTSNDQVVLAKVDVSKNKLLADNCGGINVCPTIIIFKDQLNQVHRLDSSILPDAHSIVDTLRAGGDTIFNIQQQQQQQHHYDAADYVTVFDVHPLQHVANFFGKIDKAKVMLFFDRQAHGAAAFEFKYRQYFQLHKGSKAPLIVIQTKRGESYSKDNLESVDDIEAFVEDYKAGKLSVSQEDIQHVVEVFSQGFRGIVMDDGPVMEVDAQSFQKEIITSGKNVFLELGPWCQWCESCKTLDQILLDAAAHYKEEPNVVFVKLYNNDLEIRCKDLLEDPFAVNAIPTLYFKRGSGKKFTIYHGLRTAEHITTFIQTNKDEATTNKPVEIRSLEEVINLTEDHKIVIVGFFTEFSGKAYDNFSKAADMLKNNYEFRTLHDEHLPNRKRGPVVRLFNPFLLKQFETKNFDIYDLVKFIKEKGLPPVILHNKHPKSIVDIFFYSDNWKDKAMLFINRNDEGADHLISKYMEVVKKCKKKDIIFMLGDVEDSKDAFQSSQPIFVILSLRDRYVKECLTCNDDMEALVKNHEYIDFDGVVKLVENARKTSSEEKNDKVILFIKRRKDVLPFTQEYEAVVEKYKGQRSLTFLPVKVEKANIYMSYFLSERPAMIIMNTNGEISVKKCLNIHDIKGFVNDYQEGKVAKYMKLIRPRHVVQSVECDLLFESIVMQSENNVLLVVESEKWINMGKLTAVLDGVARHLAKEKDLAFVIRRMPFTFVESDPDILEFLTPVLHHLKTLSDFDEPTFFFIMKDGGVIEAYDSDIITPQSIITWCNDIINRETQV